jgi:Uma2 family endonuclease
MVQQVTEFDTADDLDFYPESDGQPMAENTIQFRWIVLIKEGLEILFASVLDVFVAGDLLWYPVRGNKYIKCAPDAMVAIGRPKGDRGSYIQHLEGNVAPQVVFEVLSPGNRSAEMKRKFNFYQKYGVEEYYIYDPIKNNLQGWLRSNSILKPIANINNWTSPRLNIKFVLTPTTLEIYHPNGRKFSTPVEIEQRCQQAEQQAQLERQQRLQAEQQAQLERQQRLQAEQQAQLERQQRLQAEQQAQLERQQRELERQARFDAVRQLLQMGLSVEQVAQALSLTVEEVEQIR